MHYIQHVAALTAAVHLYCFEPTAEPTACLYPSAMLYGICVAFKVVETD